MFGLLCGNVHFKRMECVSRISAWKWCNLTYHTCIYKTLRFFGQFGQFSGHFWPEVGPKSQNWSRQTAWGYSVAKIELFWCATLDGGRICRFWAIFWPFWPRFCPRRGRHWAMGGSTAMFWLLKNVPGTCPIHFCPETAPITHRFCTCKKYGSKRTRKMAGTGQIRFPRSKNLKAPKNMWKMGTFGISWPKLLGHYF